MTTRQFIASVALAASLMLAGWYHWQSTSPQTSEEEVFLACLELATEGIREMERVVLIDFKGGSTTSDAEMRKRIINSRSRSKLTFIDLFPAQLQGIFRDPSTGRRAHELEITIIEWHSPNEVVVSIMFSSAPLVGGGGKFILSSANGVWSVQQTLESVRI